MSNSKKDSDISTVDPIGTPVYAEGVKITNVSYPEDCNDSSFSPHKNITVAQEAKFRVIFVGDSNNRSQLWHQLQ